MYGQVRLPVVLVPAGPFQPCLLFMARAAGTFIDNSFVRHFQSLVNFLKLWQNGNGELRKVASHAIFFANFTN
jgi:hypothetical protein